MERSPVRRAQVVKEWKGGCCGWNTERKRRKEMSGGEGKPRSCWALQGLVFTGKCRGKQRRNIKHGSDVSQVVF